MAETTRRDFLKLAAGAGASLALTSAGSFGQENHAEVKYGISMVNLPYEEGALAPYISERTIGFHYFKHHQGYYNLLRAWIKDHEDYQKQTVEELIRINKGGILLDESVFDIAVLLYNHNCYWPSLAPGGGGAPRGTIGSMVDASFGSYDAFRKTFIAESMKLGVGWVWLVADGEKLKVYRSEYQDTPLVKGYRPLLAVDVWEHAYYLDYQNERQKYVEAVLDHLLNWEQAGKMLSATASR